MRKIELVEELFPHTQAESIDKCIEEMRLAGIALENAKTHLRLAAEWVLRAREA